MADDVRHSDSGGRGGDVTGSSGGGGSGGGGGIGGGTGSGVGSGGGSGDRLPTHICVPPLPPLPPLSTHVAAAVTALRTERSIAALVHAAGGGGGGGADDVAPPIGPASVAVDVSLGGEHRTAGEEREGASSTPGTGSGGSSSPTGSRQSHTLLAATSPSAAAMFAPLVPPWPAPGAPFGSGVGGDDGDRSGGGGGGGGGGARGGEDAGAPGHTLLPPPPLPLPLSHGSDPTRTPGRGRGGATARGSDASPLPSSPHVVHVEGDGDDNPTGGAASGHAPRPPRPGAAPLTGWAARRAVCAAWWRRVSPWREELAAASLLTAAKAVAGSGTARLRVRWRYGVVPAFNNATVETAYWDHILNETATNFLVCIFIELLAGTLYLLNDLVDTFRPYLLERLLLRSTMIVFMAAGLVVYAARNRLPSRVVSVYRVASLVGLSAFINARMYYEPTFVTYVRGMGIWSITLKTGAVVTEVGALRVGMVVIADTIIQSAVMEARAAAVESPWRWTLMVLVAFLALGTFKDFQERLNFVNRVELLLSRAIAEEASRLHRFLTDNTLDMICVHDAIEPGSGGGGSGGGEAGSSDGPPLARTKYVSQACVAITGWSREELYSRSPLDFIHPQDLANAIRLYTRSSPDGSGVGGTSWFGEARGRGRSTTDFVTPRAPLRMSPTAAGGSATGGGGGGGSGGGRESGIDALARLGLNPPRTPAAAVPHVGRDSPAAGNEASIGASSGWHGRRSASAAAGLVGTFKAAGESWETTGDGAAGSLTMGFDDLVKIETHTPHAADRRGDGAVFGGRTGHAAAAGSPSPTRAARGDAKPPLHTDAGADVRRRLARVSAALAAPAPFEAGAGAPARYRGGGSVYEVGAPPATWPVVSVPPPPAHLFDAAAKPAAATTPSSRSSMEEAASPTAPHAAALRPADDGSGLASTATDVPTTLHSVPELPRAEGGSGVDAGHTRSMGMRGKGGSSSMGGSSAHWSRFTSLATIFSRAGTSSTAASGKLPAGAGGGGGGAGSMVMAVDATAGVPQAAVAPVVAGAARLVRMEELHHAALNSRMAASDRPGESMDDIRLVAPPPRTMIAGGEVAPAPRSALPLRGDDSSSSPPRPGVPAYLPSAAAPPLVSVPPLPHGGPAQGPRPRHPAVLRRHGGDTRLANPTIELRWRHRDGGYIWLEVTRNETGEGVVCVYRDASVSRLNCNRDDDPVAGTGTGTTGAGTGTGTGRGNNWTAHLA